MRNFLEGVSMSEFFVGYKVLGYGGPAALAFNTASPFAVVHAVGVREERGDSCEVKLYYRLGQEDSVGYFVREVPGKGEPVFLRQMPDHVRDIFIAGSRLVVEQKVRRGDLPLIKGSFRFDDSTDVDKFYDHLLGYVE
jgi:hypothetical protein